MRAGVTLLFEQGQPQALPQGSEVSRKGDGYRAVFGNRFDLEFEPLSAPLDLDGAGTRLCRVHGSLGGRELDCLGTATETVTAPAWEELDALRGISALFDGEHAVVALARRPRGALGHGDERVIAWIVAGGEADAGRGRPHLDGLRRRRPPAQRRARALAARRGLPAPRVGHGRGRHHARARRPAGERGGVLVADGGSRRRRRLRVDRARRAGGRLIRAVISDFGGVLTTPLIALVPRLPGALGHLGHRSRPGDGEAHRGVGRGAPALRARVRQDQRGGVPRRHRARPRRRRQAGRVLGDLLRAPRSQRADDRLHALAARPRHADGAADEQRARMGAVVAREAARDRRDLRGGGGLGVRRDAQARARDLRAHARAARWRDRARRLRVHRRHRRELPDGASRSA